MMFWQCCAKKEKKKGFFISILATDNKSSFALVRWVPKITIRTNEATKTF